MAGILDSKTRVMDFILTDEGRRQIRSGDLQISYASFSDLGEFYSEESGSVASDASSRIHFEAHSRFQDRIVVESSLGSIKRFSARIGPESYDLAGAQIAMTLESPSRANELLTGSEVVEMSDDILAAIMQNFTDNQFIAKEDVFSYKQGFDLPSQNIEFRPTTESPIDTWLFTADNGDFRPPGLASFDPIAFDARFAHFPNYKFLPPINKRGAGKFSGLPMGKYPRLNQEEILTYDDLKQTLMGKEMYELKFDPTSRDNNIMIQPFEFNTTNGSVHKLVVVDYGVFPNEKKTSAGVHVFFLGKIIPSRDGSYKYFNIFTLELDV